MSENNTKDLDLLKEKISRLMAALAEVNFECQRLEIINSNLDFQLKEANRELNQNIAVLQALEEENEEFLNNKYYQNFLLTSVNNRKMLEEKLKTRSRKELNYE